MLMLTAIRKALLICFLLNYSGCAQPIEWENLGPDARADFVVVLRKDLTQLEVNQFLEEELVAGSIKKSFRLRSGVGALVKASIDGYSGYAVKLDPHASAAERLALRRGLTSSPFVYKVFEDTSPAEIRLEGSSAVHLPGSR